MSGARAIAVANRCFGAVAKVVGRVNTKPQVLMAQEACSGPYNGSATLRPLTKATRRVAPLSVVLAGAEFDSEHNHRRVHERLGAVGVIPAKRGKATWPASRPPSPSACGLSEPVVSAAGAGGERVFSGEAQAVGTSTRSEPWNAAYTGAAIGACLQPVPAKVLLFLKLRSLLRKDVNRAR